MQRRHVSSF